jgi:hypothetical protein
MEKVLEKWEATQKGWVNKFDPAGNGRTVSERVLKGRSFYITPEERSLLNSDRVRDEFKDPFKNGHFRPVKMDAINEAREYEESIAAQAREAAAPNPNHMTDDELGGLYSIRNFPKFRKAASQISSPAVLTRLLGLSENEEYDATVSQINLVKQLLGDDAPAAEVLGGPDVTEIEQVGHVGGSMEDRDSGLQPFRGVR